MSYRARIAKGIGANAAGQLITVATQLAGLPTLIALWGTQLYGEWLVLSSLATFLSMSDVGLPTAAANEMTMLVGKGKRAEAAQAYYALRRLLTIVGALALVIATPILWFTPLLAAAPLVVTSRVDAAATLTALALHVFLTQQVAVRVAGLRSDGNYHVGKLIISLGRLAEFFAIVGCAASGGSLPTAATLMAATQLGVLLASSYSLGTRSPWLKSTSLNSSCEYSAFHLFGPGLAFIGIPLGHALSNQGMVQVIASQMGASAVATFAAHRTIANVLLQLSNMLSNSVWPELSTALGAGDVVLARRLNRLMSCWTFWFTAASAIGLTWVGPALLSAWTGGEIACDQLLLGALMAATVLRTAWWTSSVILMAVNKHIPIATAYVLGTAGSLGAAAMLCPVFGFLGAALSLAAVDIVMIVRVIPRSLSIVGDSPWAYSRAIVSPPTIAIARQ